MEPQHLLTASTHSIYSQHPLTASSHIESQRQVTDDGVTAWSHKHRATSIEHSMEPQHLLTASTHSIHSQHRVTSSHSAKSQMIEYDRVTAWSHSIEPQASSIVWSHKHLLTASTHSIHSQHRVTLSHNVKSQMIR